MKNKYYVVSPSDKTVLAEFTNFADAHAFQMDHKCTRTTQIWGFNPSELKPTRP